MLWNLVRIKFFCPISQWRTACTTVKVSVGKDDRSSGKVGSPHLPAPEQLVMRLGSGLQATWWEANNPQNLQLSSHVHWTLGPMIRGKTRIPNCQVPSTQHGRPDQVYPFIPDPMSKPLKFHHHLSQAENTFSEELLKTGTTASWYFVQIKQALDTKLLLFNSPLSLHSVC